MRKLFLHIGAHRTATTAIQKTLRKNFDALVRQGILYPYGVHKHFNIANRLLNGSLPAAELAADLNARAAGKNTEIRSIILSEEDISMRRDLSVLAALRDHFDVKIIYALRRQDLWLESWYLQNVKGQWNPALAHLTFDQFMARQEEFHWIDYERYCRHLDAVFGPDNVNLYVFEKAFMPEGPVAKFCDLAGIRDYQKLTPAEGANPSLDPLVTEFMRKLPLDTATQSYRKALISVCTQVSRDMNKDARPTLLLAPDRRAAVLDRYAAGNRDLARRRFERDELFLDPLPAADAPIAEMRLPEDSEELMSRFVVPFVTALIDRNR